MQMQMGINMNAHAQDAHRVLLLGNTRLKLKELKHVISRTKPLDHLAV
jgi:hypothetical protein